MSIIINKSKDRYRKVKKNDYGKLGDFSVDVSFH